MSSPKITMPSSPDPAALAAQQGQNNLEAAIATSLLNQVNEVTPYGTVTYSRNQPTGGSPRPVGAQQTPLWRGGGPNGMGFGRGANNGFTAPRGAMPGRGGGGQGGFNIGGMNIPSFTRTVTLSPEQQAKFDAQNRIEGSMANIAESQINRVGNALGQGFDMSGLPNAVSGVNAAPIQGFNPQTGQIQSSLQEFNPMMGINTSGLMGIGGDFAQQAQSLEQNTFDRGRALLEPQFGRAMDRAELRLSERGLPLSSQAGSEILGGVQNEQNRALNELALSSVAAGRAEQERLANQAMRVRGQQFGERGQIFDATNQARGQAFGQGLMGAQFGNQAQQQQYAQQQQANALNNQLQQQSFNQAASNAALQNAARQQAIQERAYVRNIPLNDIAALMGQSGGVQLPQFQQSPNVAVQAGDLLGATLGLNQQNIDVQKANQQASGGLLGGLMGLGGSLGSAAIMSDIRLKENIKKIGKYRGHNLYEYNYKSLPKKVMGVMAQEIEKVIPDAVIEIGGFKAVNYGVI